MEPTTLAFLLGLVSLLGIAGGTAIAYWHRILDWSEKAVIPWMERRGYNRVIHHVRSAFVAIDRVVVPVRREAIRAWRTLRQFLIKHEIEILEIANNRFTQRAIFWLRDQEQRSQKVTKVVEEVVVERDELPADVRAALIRQVEPPSIDVTQIRDREIELLAQELAI